jgi:hypothetical protein
MKHLTLLLAIALTFLPGSLHASVDDAHSFAMEAATPFVSEGFIVREDYWNGEVKSGQKLMVKHQLFKGNEYAFWLGTANEDCKLEIEVLDEKGNKIHITPKIGIGPTTSDDGAEWRPVQIQEVERPDSARDGRWARGRPRTVYSPRTSQTSPKRCPAC